MKYLVEVFWSDDDDGYIAVVPDLPGCSAFGTTPEAAVHEIGDSTLAWIAACRASGGREHGLTGELPSRLQIIVKRSLDSRKKATIN
jgi:antitoxin HicB